MVRRSITGIELTGKGVEDLVFSTLGMEVSVRELG